MEYLCNDRDMFPIGEFELFKPETASNNDPNTILLWVQGVEKLSMIKRRDNVIRHVYFDTLSIAGLKPTDVVNDDSRQHIYFEKGRNDNYFLLQQNTGRPKLICFDEDFHIKKVLFNDQWEQYPAFFKRDFDLDTLYIAILRQGIEPLDFRNVILKDFRVDLTTLRAEEVRLDFKERVFHYGKPDKHNVYWLFTNGFLYSYNASNNALDSIYICNPVEKGFNVANIIKGSNYPTTLHRNSSTFWISFFPARQLYKINLQKKRLKGYLRRCMDQKDCDLPGDFMIFILLIPQGFI